jgi:hypothetical protein
MIKLLTIFNLLAGGASIAGLYVSMTALAIQRGEFTISGWGPVAIESDEPFASPPRVEVINYRGYTTITPSVVQLTEQHAVFKRDGPSAPTQPESYRWGQVQIFL